MKNLISKTIEDTNYLANIISKILKVGDVLFLKGDLGSGKTTFTKELIKNLSKNDAIEVTSPTFSIVNSYKIQNFNLFHIDLYRLSSKEELLSLGLFENIDESIYVIEWPDMIMDMFSDFLEIDIDVSLDQNSNYIRKFSFNKILEKRLENLNDI